MFVGWCWVAVVAGIRVDSLMGRQREKVIKRGGREVGRPWEIGVQ